MCKACGSRDTSAGKLARFQQQFAQDLEPSSPGAPQTLGDMTDRLKVGAFLAFCLSCNAEHGINSSFVEFVPKSEMGVAQLDAGLADAP